MNIREILNHLVRSLSVKKNGKTILLRTGVDRYPNPFHILVPSMQYGTSVYFGDKKNPEMRFITPDKLETTRGHDYPLVIDHETLLWIFESCMDEIHNMESIQEGQKKIIDDLLYMISVYQKDALTLWILLIESNNIKWYEFKKRTENQIKVHEYIKNRRKIIEQLQTLETQFKSWKES